MSVARVLVVDDHPLFRQGLSGLLRELPAVELVGQAASGEEALDLVAADEPDVVLMDLHMPGIGGIEATRRLTSGHPNVAVLVLTMLDDDDSLRSAIAAGARWCLLKEATPQEIVGSIKSVVAGQAVFGSAVSGRVLAALATSASPADSTASRTVSPRCSINAGPLPDASGRRDYAVSVGLEKLTAGTPLRREALGA